MISSHLTQLNYYFPWNLVVSLLLAIIFSVIGVIIYRSATTKDEKEPIVKPQSTLLNKIHLFFARFGYSSTDPLSQSFAYALELMHDFIGGTQFRYQLPWIVMLGTSSAGKTTVLQNLALDRPIGRPNFETKSQHKPLCDWWFYNHGIVLDVDGNLVLNSSQVNSDEDNWKLFLNLLTHYRPKRALDGVILTIPASELIGKDRLSHDEIMLRAGYLYGKLWQMQHITGFKVPVYIMITKCDLVPGFQSFCKAVPSHNKHDMFGWSNSHPIDSSYDTGWIDEAFFTLNGSLYQDQEEIYADGRNLVNSDDIFLFPYTLNTLKDGIRTYSDNLFKSSGYHESFFLRGIYFVGDSNIEAPTLKKQALNEVSLKVGSIHNVEHNQIYFSDNLFEYKAFREVGLARPLSQALLGNSTAIRFGKITIAVAVVLGTLGLLRANDTLQRAKVNLVPALSQIDVTLEKIQGQNAQTDMGRIFFDDQAQVLLNTMTQISVNHLSSIFIPASWLSSIDLRIKYVMSLAYDQVIFQSLSSQLNYKATQLFAGNSTISVTETPGNGIYPLETIEFYRLQNYVISTQALELAAQKFNELGSSGNLNDVADIIKYLFNYDMPKAFFIHSNYYTSTLKFSNLRPFDFKTYQTEASTKLHALFDQFQLACFDPARMIPGLGQLSTTLNEITGTQNYTTNADVLRNVYVSLNETVTSIQNPGLQWINADVFNPGPQYDYIMGLISASNFFTHTELTNFTHEINQNFLIFRKQLALYASPLIDGENIFSTEANLAVNKPSDGTLSLQQYLTLFFNESFMAQASKQSIITSIPTGSILLWDVLRLQQAVSIATDYTNFMNSRLLNMPKALQPLLHKVGSENLTQNIVQYLAEAEVFNSDASGSLVSSPEDALLTQVQNYRTASPYLEQILSTLKVNSTVTYGTLKGLLNTEVYLPLQKLDAILGAEAPYAIKMDSFDWWEGQPMAALEAYNVFNVTELKNYLQQQRDRINYLAQEFSEPLVSLLEQINIESMPGNLPLIKKWQEILDELSGYTRKNPGNELAELETFITTPLNEVTLSTCSKYTDDSKLMVASQDFFTRIHISLIEKLQERCADLSGSVSMGTYSQIAKFFNANLAGKFPFVEDVTAPAPDAAPQDIRTFFELLDNQGTDVKAALAEAKNLGTAGQNALTFIKQIEQVRSFFGDYLTPNSTLPSPAFAFDVTFRVNKSKEERANEILNWELTSQDTTITMRSTSPTGYWSAGDPVTVTFRWAQNSPLQPQGTEGVLGYNAQGEDASFSYSGTWAFLRLLLQHQAKASDFADLNDEDPTTLRFDIPLTNVVANSPSTLSSIPSCLPSSPSSASSSSSSVDKLPTAAVFVRLKVSPIKMKAPAKPAPAGSASSSSSSSSTSSSTPSTPQKPKIEAGPPVSLPYFPYQAPRLTSETKI
ncbi:MAG: hypothetical protein KBD36_00700 [Alphaproteobacteria bacterium]|nr:hypothetical protein [Alphaproteobacteria bacterium]MBP9776352.1 hypothetical protein [Alphaproteobacteria bacterium]